jgi:hypothetical protein
MIFEQTFSAEKYKRYYILAKVPIVSFSDFDNYPALLEKHRIGLELHREPTPPSGHRWITETEAIIIDYFRNEAWLNGNTVARNRYLLVEAIPLFVEYAKSEVRKRKISKII